MIEAVIFDLDCVLTRSDRYHTAAWRKNLGAWGIPFGTAQAPGRGVSGWRARELFAAREAWN